MTKVAFKQCDLERSIRALEKRGHLIKGVEHLPDGSVRILTGGAEGSSEPVGANEWDEVLSPG